MYGRNTLSTAKIWLELGNIPRAYWRGSVYGKAILTASFLRDLRECESNGEYDRYAILDERKKDCLTIAGITLRILSINERGDYVVSLAHIPNDVMTISLN